MSFFVFSNYSSTWGPILLWLTTFPNLLSVEPIHCMGLRLKMLVGSPLKGKYSVNQLKGVLVELEAVEGALVVVVVSSTTICLLMTSVLIGCPLETKLIWGLRISVLTGVLVLTRILLFCLLFSAASFSSSVLTRWGKSSGSVLYCASWERSEIVLEAHLGVRTERENKRKWNLKKFFDQKLFTLFQLLDSLSGVSHAGWETFCWLKISRSVPPPQVQRELETDSTSVTRQACTGLSRSQRRHNTTRATVSTVNNNKLPEITFTQPGSTPLRLRELQLRNMRGANKEKTKVLVTSLLLVTWNFSILIAAWFHCFTIFNARLI